MPRLTLFRSGRLECSLRVEGAEITIGRLPGHGITLESPTVSRTHARIVERCGRYMLEDLGSVNGTLVRGRRVKLHPLVAGDSIGIEEYTLVFEPPDELFRAAEARRDPGTGGSRAARASDPDMTFLNIQRFMAPPDSD